MNLRFHALTTAIAHKSIDVDIPQEKPSSYFGCNVFDITKMQQYLSKKAFEAVVAARENGGKIPRAVADEVASGMKEWAQERGATHYAHWFQPLTGATAEKHDSFLEFDYENAKAIDRFSGSLLVQQEPDASSFPSGGIRTTFEARGYTAWDSTSPAFLLGDTLCIPSIFISYTGESLDYKAPLLKTNALLDKAATAVCQYFDRKVKKVISTLGWEQEFFLVDAALYDARPDLILTGRTLLGHASARDQQLEDHYFGSIPERAASFIRDLEIECYKLGIPVKTRHNEVAPNQFEIAPMYENVDVAVDHNILVMDLMKRVGRKHNFMVLLHEKPFTGINGSGKHNNWSMATDTGENLLQPGKTVKTGLQFLTFMVNVVKAVHDNADLLLSSIASTGNEHRLGGNEAPPAIISVFLGSQLTRMLDTLENEIRTGIALSSDGVKMLTLDIEHIPEIHLDNTDRNRTSPFAFTGNKFEFRAVGSAANCSTALIVLHSAVANQLMIFKTEVDAMIAQGAKKEDAILQILHNYVIVSKNIRFDGNNYSVEWQEEAKRRGLPNVTSAPGAWKALTSKKAADLFCSHNIFTHRELEARYEIYLETYIKKILIEAKVLEDLVINNVIPTAVKYQNVLLENVTGLKTLFDDALIDPTKRVLYEISSHINSIQDLVVKLKDAVSSVDEVEHLAERALRYSKDIRSLLDSIRSHSDKLEMMVDNDLWPLPKYHELLFIR
jgi:glutamine synthetase